MKDHKIAEFVNELRDEVLKVCPDAPQCLRETIARVVRRRLCFHKLKECSYVG